jgi:transposase
MKPIEIFPLPERRSLLQRSPEMLVSIILAQQEMIEQLAEEVERLRNRTRSNGQTTSKPPSSDLPQRSEKSKNDTSVNKSPPRRKLGGQMENAGRTRRGFGQIDRYEVLHTEACCACGRRQFTNAPLRVNLHPVTQLSERPIEVVEDQQYTCQCQRCRVLGQGQLPEKMVVVGQSLRVSLQALLVWLGNYGHLSYEKQQELLLELGKIEVDTRKLQATNQRLSETVSDAAVGLSDWVKQQGHVHVDETPWLVKGVKEWTWLVASVEFVVFHPADTRGRCELEQMLGQSFSGCLSSDDFSVYNGYAVTSQQKWLAHLQQHFKHVIQLEHGNNPQLEQVFLDLLNKAFQAHQQWQETQEHTVYRRWARGFKRRLQRWLTQSGHADGLLLRSLHKKVVQWWHFLDHREVSPDNNRAQRSLRLAVTKRKFCDRSCWMRGFPQPVRILTSKVLLFVIQTCCAQGRSALTFLQQALIAVQNEIQPMPSLIPAPTI